MWVLCRNYPGTKLVLVRRQQTQLKQGPKHTNARTNSSYETPPPWYEVVIANIFESRKPNEHENKRPKSRFCHRLLPEDAIKREFARKTF
jgi:hypothetical protein